MKTFEEAFNESCQIQNDPNQEKLILENLADAAKDIIACDKSRNAVMCIVELHLHHMSDNDHFSVMCNMVAAGMAHGIRIGQEMEKP